MAHGERRRLQAAPRAAQSERNGGRVRAAAAAAALAQRQEWRQQRANVPMNTLPRNSRSRRGGRCESGQGRGNARARVVRAAGVVIPVPLCKSRPAAPMPALCLARPQRGRGLALASAACPTFQAQISAPTRPPSPQLHFST